MEWMLMPFKKFAQFSGRSRRKEYWMFVLLVVIISTLLQIVEEMLGIAPERSTTVGVGAGGNGPLSGLFGLIILVPGIAVTVRRLHDVNRSGWWILLPVGIALALVGGVIYYAFQGGGGTDGMTAVGSMGLLLLAYLVVLVGWVVMMCLSGTRGPNRFGSDPKDPGGDLGSVFS